VKVLRERSYILPLTNRRMNEYTVAETEAAPITHTKDSQYQLSKKVAQLIKVIVQLM